MLAQGTAYELGQHCINVNVIARAAETPLTIDFLSDPELRKQVEATILIGRRCSARRDRQAAVFLASAEADYLTGAHVRVDGGLIAGRGKV
jgi:NAD(P)-dependent dehydrogenase (short-subunit alcohol dehydrogenase family)